jgi:hypothetical protein
MAFCWLGLAADKFALLFEGMGVTMPTMTGLVSKYGMIACPILGIVAATSLVLTDKLRSGFGRMAKPTLIIIYTLLVVNILMSLMPPIGTISSIALN